MCGHEPRAGVLSVTWWHYSKKYNIGSANKPGFHHVGYNFPSVHFSMFSSPYLALKCSVVLSFWPLKYSLSCPCILISTSDLYQLHTLPPVWLTLPHWTCVDLFLYIHFEHWSGAMLNEKAVHKRKVKKCLLLKGWCNELKRFTIIIYSCS